MSSSESDSEFTYDSQDSDIVDINFIPGYAIEDAEEQEPQHATSSGDSFGEDELAYADEPLADEEWEARYEEEVKTTEEQDQRLKNRLDGTERISEWCTCGNCNVEYLQNPSECYCCSELDGCVEALESDIVLQDVEHGVVLTCITSHPGFNSVCLQKWSLRLASGKYSTKSKTRYRQTGSEERFLRSISYREFSRLVYGMLGNKRIPLPACAYTAIRQTFAVSGKDENFRGFDADDDL